MKNNEPKNYWQNDKGPNPSFVVDLRQAALKFEKEIKKEEKIIKKRVEYLKPDLLRKESVKRNISLSFLKNIFNVKYLLFLKRYLEIIIPEKKKVSLSNLICVKEEAFVKALKVKFRKKKKNDTQLVI